MGVSSSGRCEKIDLETWSNFGLEKNRARTPYKRPLGLRHTFGFTRNFSQIDFFTSSCHRVTVEAQSISDTGQFLPSPNGTEYKGFFNTAEGAQNFSAAQTATGGPETSVVSATAPTDLVNSSPVHSAATEGPGVLIHIDNLPQVKPQ
jgi:hypothetical protein